MRPSHWDNRCSICHRVPGVDRRVHGDHIAVHCSNWCGKYEIDVALDERFQNLRSNHPDYDLRPYLGCYTRQNPGWCETSVLTEGNWRELAERHRDRPLLSKLDRLLEAMARRAGAHTRYVEYSRYSSDGHMADEPNIDLLPALVIKLVDDGFIEFERCDEDLNPIRYAVTVAGWIKYENACAPAPPPHVEEVEESAARDEAFGKSDPDESNTPKPAPLGEIFRTIRRKKDEKQSKVADDLHINRATLSRIENGRRSPGRKLAEAMMKYYDIDPGQVSEDTPKI